MKNLFTFLFHFMVFMEMFSFIESGFQQRDQAAYLQAWGSISQYSYQESLPLQLQTSCKTTNNNTQINYINFPAVSLSGTFDSASFQTACGTLNLCVLTQGSTLIMNGNLNVAALKILGTVYWNDTSQTQPFQWLCAGYVVVESNGAFALSLNSPSFKAYVYLKNNGAVHPNLRTRVLGGYNTDFSITGPTIDVTGRIMKRTWSLLYKTVPIGSNKIQLIHNPADMGWQVGDRIVIAPTTSGSKGNAEGYYIKAINAADNSILLDMELTKQAFSSYILHNGTSSSVALMSAEVINLSRNVIITGDDFNHVTCDPTLTLTKGVNPMGCACDPSIGRTACTMGLNTIMAGKGVYKIQYSRIEKCGQRGIFSKYCLHFHKMGVSPQSLLRGNAIENSQQRGIIVHDTHLVRVEENVLNDVRGTGIYLQDGNEMYNQIMYNVVVCPTAKDGPLGGCTIPGTDNGQSDATLNQAGLWANSRTNDMVGNRFSNSFNGMFYDFGDTAPGAIEPLHSILGRVEGNTFHGHGRFGTYVLQYFPQASCIGDINNDGFISASCQAFTSTGLDNGYAVVLLNNVDYDNVFVGGYSYGDVQYRGHIAHSNNNNVYWKDSKNFADGCSAHISNSYYSDGNMALPDSAAFIIENTVFTGSSTFETNHHCNEGTTGFLCMPTYVFLNVSIKAITSKTWVDFKPNGNNYGGILVLSPPEASNPIGAGGFFPPTYQSLVSFYYSYLLGFGSAVCEKAINMNNAWPGVPTNVMNNRYQGGIFCRKPVRSLKIYTNGLSKGSAYNMSLEVWQGTTFITSFVATYHQIGSDLSGGRFQPRQGYAFPVIADTNYEYRLSMINSGTIKYPNGNLPSDWIVEFSDPVFGNRWTPDKIILTVRGQGCDKKLVTSQHDRRWVWSQNDFYPSPQAWGRGACNSANPDMPTVTCPAVPKSIPNLACDGQCSSTCQNGYCDCGSKQCVCNPGFSGPSCSLNICDAARCGSHGRCIATYLGGDLLPSQGTCVCDQGWSGPNCDQNVCSGVTCSGRGYCQAKGDTDHQCICDSSYFGYNCEKVKQDSCSICPSNFMSVCGTGKLIDNKQFFCLAGSGPGVGCYYSTTYATSTSSSCCYANCEKCDLVNCPPATNDCHLSGACNPLDGTCGAQTQRTDGSPCNSIPYGVCQQGVCQASALTPSRTPSYVPSSAPTVKPSQIPTFIPSVSPSRIPSYRPSFTPTSVPSVIPTYTPSVLPTTARPSAPTYVPSYNPTSPTTTPTYGPSASPTYAPSFIPSVVPTCTPSSPTYSPSNIPSTTPTYSPSFTPTYIPSANPSYSPTLTPSAVPSIAVNYQYLGCYGDGAVRVMDKSLAKVNSVLDCYFLAITNGYSLYGLQYGGECWVSNDLAKSEQHGLCGACTTCAKPTCNCAAMKCTNGDNCGDGRANDLYMITTSGGIQMNPPSLKPSSAPTIMPSMKPSQIPTFIPSVSPSRIPSYRPSFTPTSVPSVIPTYTPSVLPTTARPSAPTYVPSYNPTSPTTTPTYGPSASPTYAPSFIPSVVPTCTPSSPTYSPSNIPSTTPTYTPSVNPSYSPTLTPSAVPSIAVNYQYLGCYGDGAVRVMDKSLAKVNSVLDCYFLAITNGYSLYGLQYGGECWVSNDLAKSEQHGLCGACTTCAKPTCNCAAMKCTNGDNCGDGRANDLYMITTSGGIQMNPPSLKPSSAPTIMPSMKPSQIPTFVPSNAPSKISTFIPSLIPTSLSSFTTTYVPSLIPTFVPSSTPSIVPTSLPSISHSVTPYYAQSVSPTLTPSYTSFIPTYVPSVMPTFTPSYTPSFAPSMTPTVLPSITPTLTPTCSPSVSPTLTPSYTSFIPTYVPSVMPTFTPSYTPSFAPSMTPTVLPSITPTLTPTCSPSVSPTLTPSYTPSFIPAYVPSVMPTFAPSYTPSFAPSMTPAVLSSITPTLTPTCSPSVSHTLTPSYTPSFMPTFAPSYTPSFAPSMTPTVLPSITPTLTPTCSPSASPTLKPSYTSFIPTYAPSVMPTFAPSYTPSFAPSMTPTVLPSITPSLTPTCSPSVSHTLKPSYTPSFIPTFVPSVMPTFAPSYTPSFAPSMTPTVLPSITPTLTPTCSPSVSHTLKPSYTPSFMPTFAPSYTPSFAPSMTPTVLPSITPTLTPTCSPSVSPTLKPSYTSFIPTFVPSVMPTFAPSYTPSFAPSMTPTVLPSITPSLTPTCSPSVSPTLTPSYTSFIPTFVPSVMPTFAPSYTPSFAPSMTPTVLPSITPTLTPTCSPSVSPTLTPSYTPSFIPTYVPSVMPTFAPSYTPSFAPSMTPTVLPSITPTLTPTCSPSVSPTLTPSYTPSFIPTYVPSVMPTFAPSYTPSFAPSMTPTVLPSITPTLTPTCSPSVSPTLTPSYTPSFIPTYVPSVMPTFAPSYTPSFAPSMTPTVLSSITPTLTPTYSPSVSPTLTPSYTSFIPTYAPSVMPTFAPSYTPSFAPSMTPTVLPSITPTLTPTYSPSVSHTLTSSYTPSFIASVMPTFAPSYTPSFAPSMAPTVLPTMMPTLTPTYSPSVSPTLTPSYTPSFIPTYVPSVMSTFAPSYTPSFAPSTTPTVLPSITPTLTPTYSPSVSPTLTPSYTPTFSPTILPSFVPSVTTTCRPSTTTNTLTPSLTLTPSAEPSNLPSYEPSVTVSHTFPTYSPSNTSNDSPIPNSPSYAPSLVPLSSTTPTVTSTLNAAEINAKSETRFSSSQFLGSIIGGMMASLLLILLMVYCCYRQWYSKMRPSNPPEKNFELYDIYADASNFEVIKVNPFSRGCLVVHRNDDSSNISSDSGSDMSLDNLFPRISNTRNDFLTGLNPSLSSIRRTNDSSAKLSTSANFINFDELYDDNEASKSFGANSIV